MKSKLQQLIDEALEGTTLETCKMCGTALNYNNVAYWVDLGLCRSCVNDPLDANTPVAADLLVKHGTLVVARMHGRWSLRIEYKTSNKEEIITLKTGLGGRIYRNDRKSQVWKWAACSKRDIHAVARNILRIGPTLGRLLIEYTSTENQAEMTLYSQGIAHVFQKRSIPLSEIT